MKYICVFLFLLFFNNCHKPKYFKEVYDLEKENKELKRNNKQLAKQVTEMSVLLQEHFKKTRQELNQKDTTIKYLKKRKGYATYTSDKPTQGIYGNSINR